MIDAGVSAWSEQWWETAQYLPECPPCPGADHTLSHWLNAGRHRALASTDQSVAPIGVNLVTLEFGVFARRCQADDPAARVDFSRRLKGELD